MEIDDLEIDAARARLRYLAARCDLKYTESPAAGDGLRAVLARRDGEEELYFAVVPRSGGYLSLSLVLVVDEAFFRENLDAILDVTSRYEAAVSLARNETLAEGEVYLNDALNPAAHCLFAQFVSDGRCGQRVKIHRAWWRITGRR